MECGNTVFQVNFCVEHTYNTCGINCQGLLCNILLAQWYQFGTATYILDTAVSAFHDKQYVNLYTIVEGQRSKSAVHT